MPSALTLDLIFTVLLSTGLIAAAALALWLLPWRASDLDSTERAFRALAARLTARRARFHVPASAFLR